MLLMLKLDTNYGFHELFLNSNMAYCFRFVNKRANYLDDKIALAYARCTHLSQVIKSQSQIIDTFVKVLNIYIH